MTENRMDDYLLKHWGKLNITLTQEEIDIYANRMKECNDFLLQCYKDHVAGQHEGWVKNIEEVQADGSIITLHQKTVEGSPSFTKITCTVKTTAEKALHWSTDIENSAKYDEYFDTSEFYVDLTDHMAPNGVHDRLRGYALARSQIKGFSFVLSPREFVHLIGKEQLGPEYGNIGLALMTSVDCKHIPARDSHVRGSLGYQGSIFIPNEDGTCTIIIATNIDLNGWVPGWVMTLVSNDIAITRRMRDAIHKDLAASS